MATEQLILSDARARIEHALRTPPLFNDTSLVKYEGMHDLVVLMGGVAVRVRLDIVDTPENWQ